MKHSLSWVSAARLALVLACGLCAAIAWGADLQFLEDPGEGDFDLKGTVTVKSAKDLDLGLAFNYQEDTKKHYLVTIAKGIAKVGVVSGDKVRPIGTTAKVTLKDGGVHPFTLQRRQWRIALVWDGAVLLRAYDPYLVDGTVGTRISGGTIGEPEVQPVGEILVKDDFVREEGAQSIWQPVVGTWEAKTLRDDPLAGREEVDKSANAFSYFGSGDRAISVGGHWFWDRYTAASAIKPMGSGAVGLVAYYQNDKNYLLMRWKRGAEEQDSALQLVAVRDGKEQVLAEKPGAYQPEQWYKLRLQVCEGVIQGLVDDELRLQAETPLFGQGQMGLYVEGKAGAFFDDVSTVEWELCRETFADKVPGKWSTVSGWVQQNGVMSYSGGERSLCSAGGQWERYTCAVDTASGGGGVGLVFGLQSAQDYCLLRWAPAGSKAAYHGKVQLARMSETGLAVLAEKPLPGNSAKRMLRVSIADGLLTGTVDDSLRLQALAPGLTGGAIALYAEGKGQFDNVRLSLVPVRASAHVTKEFTEDAEHPEMGSWASTKAPWVAPAEGKDEWWSKGDYFGETVVTFTVPAVGSKSGSARATIGGEPGQKSGLTLTVTAVEKSKKLVLALTAAEQPVKSAEIEVEGDAAISFGRESGLVVVRVNDEPVLTAERP